MKALASMANHHHRLGNSNISDQIEQRPEWCNPPLVLVKSHPEKEPADSGSSEDHWHFVLGYN